MSLQLIFLLIFILCSSCKNNPTNTNNSLTTTDSTIQTIGQIKIYESSVLSILDTSNAIEILAEGFEWAEGPVWIKDQNTLVFSDVPENKIYSWSEESGLQVYLEPSGYTGAVEGSYEKGSNGLAIDQSGNLIICQHGDRRLAKMESTLDLPASEFISLTDNYEGKRFNSPNDLAIAKNGDIYFTDPPYGLDNGEDDAMKELAFQGIFKWSEGRLELIAKNLSRPNGIALSLDEQKLYVANSDPKNIKWQVYTLDDRGLPVSNKVFFDANDYNELPGYPDGLKVHPSGTIFATGPGGVFIFSADGLLLARLFTERRTANCAFDTEYKTLYLTSDDYLLRLKLK